MYVCACVRICAFIYHYKRFSNFKIHINWSYFVYTIGFLIHENL